MIGMFGNLETRRDKRRLTMDENFTRTSHGHIYTITPTSFVCDLEDRQSGTEPITPEYSPVRWSRPLAAEYSHHRGSPVVYSMATRVRSKHSFESLGTRLAKYKDLRLVENDSPRRTLLAPAPSVRSRTSDLYDVVGSARPCPHGHQGQRAPPFSVLSAHGPAVGPVSTLLFDCLGPHLNTS